MADSFLYQPHVHESAGVLSPDLLIDRLFYACTPDPKWHPLPVGLLSTATVLQQVGDEAVASAALVLVTAGNGALATVGSAHGRTDGAFAPDAIGQQIAAKPVSREAVRLRDLQSHPAAWTLRTARLSGGAMDVVDETPVAALAGFDDMVARIGAAGPGARWMLFLSAGHRDTDPSRADGYEVALANEAAGIRIACTYGVIRLKQADMSIGR